MNQEQDVLSAVVAEEGVEQGVAVPESDVSQESGQDSNKDYNFRTVVADRDRYKRESEDLKARAQENENLVGMYRAMGYQQPPQQPPGYPPQQPPLPQSPAPTGLDFGDAVDSEAFNKLTGYISQQADQLSQNSRLQSEQMEQMELRMLDPNWRATIDKYLPSAIQEDSSIADTIKSSPKAWKTAYHFATRNMDYLNNKMVNQQNQEAERMVKNAEKPKSLGTTGVQSNVGGSRDAFSMSEQEFSDAKKQLISGMYNG